MNCTQNDSPGEDSWDFTEPETRKKGARILIVDDDRDMRDLLTARLISEGYEAGSAASGAELMGAAESNTGDSRPLEGVDLIVLDNRMPGITGLDTIRKLRTEGWQIPAILITAFPERAVQDEAAGLGVALLGKPFSLELLIGLIALTLLPKPDDPGPPGSQGPS